MPSRAATTRAMSDAASPICSIASAIHSTPAIPSASSGLRAASIAMIAEAAEVAVHPLLEPARPRAASFSSLKKTAA